MHREEDTAAAYLQLFPIHHQVYGLRSKSRQVTRFNFTVHARGVAVLHYLHISVAAARSAGTQRGGAAQ